MKRFEDNLAILKPVEELEKEAETTRIKSKAKRVIAVGAAVALAGAGIIAFNASKEEEVKMYGTAPIMEETQESSTDVEKSISELIKDFDPGDEEVICDYGIPTTSWEK